MKIQIVSGIQKKKKMDKNKNFKFIEFDNSLKMNEDYNFNNNNQLNFKISKNKKTNNKVNEQFVKNPTPSKKYSLITSRIDKEKSKNFVPNFIFIPVVKNKINKPLSIHPLEVNNLYKKNATLEAEVKALKSSLLKKNTIIKRYQNKTNYRDKKLNKNDIEKKEIEKKLIKTKYKVYYKNKVIKKKDKELEEITKKLNSTFTNLEQINKKVFNKGSFTNEYRSLIANLAAHDNIQISNIDNAIKRITEFIFKDPIKTPSIASIRNFIVEESIVNKLENVIRCTNEGITLITDSGKIKGKDVKNVIFTTPNNDETLNPFIIKSIATTGHSATDWLTLVEKLFKDHEHYVEFIKESINKNQKNFDLNLINVHLSDGGSEQVKFKSILQEKVNHLILKITCLEHSLTNDITNSLKLFLKGSIKTFISGSCMVVYAVHNYLLTDLSFISFCTSIGIKLERLKLDCTRFAGFIEGATTVIYLVKVIKLYYQKLGVDALADIHKSILINLNNERIMEEIEIMSFLYINYFYFKYTLIRKMKNSVGIEKVLECFEKMDKKLEDESYIGNSLTYPNEFKSKFVEIIDAALENASNNLDINLPSQNYMIAPFQVDDSIENDVDISCSNGSNVQFMNDFHISEIIKFLSKGVETKFKNKKERDDYFQEAKMLIFRTIYQRSLDRKLEFQKQMKEFELVENGKSLLNTSLKNTRFISQDIERSIGMAKRAYFYHPNMNNRLAEAKLQIKSGFKEKSFDRNDKAITQFVRKSGRDELKESVGSKKDEKHYIEEKLQMNLKLKKIQEKKARAEEKILNREEYNKGITKVPWSELNKELPSDFKKEELKEQCSIRLLPYKSGTRSVLFNRIKNFENGIVIKKKVNVKRKINKFAKKYESNMKKKKLNNN